MSSMEDKVVLLYQEKTTGMENENMFQTNEIMYNKILLQKEAFGHKRNKTYDVSQLHNCTELKSLSVRTNSKENSFQTEDCIQQKQNKIVIYILILIFSAVAIILYQFDE